MKEPMFNVEGTPTQEAVQRRVPDPTGTPRHWTTDEFGIRDFDPYKHFATIFAKDDKKDLTTRNASAILAAPYGK